MLFVILMERKEKKKKQTKPVVNISSPLRINTVKNLMHKYLENEAGENKTAVEAEAVTIFQGVLIDTTRWIMIDAEKMARYRGQKTITKDDIRAAVVNYLGDRKSN